MRHSRQVEVAPERLARWIAGFQDRHGETTAELSPERCGLTAADGARADIEVPFPPLRGASIDDLVEHAIRRRLVGVLLVRLGGYAAGVFDGDRLVASKVGSRLVHSRHKAGGWSQQRFARRREGQAREAYAAAAQVAARILLPYADRLDALVAGGDRRAVAAVLDASPLASLRNLVDERFLGTVPDPKLSVLQKTPDLFRAVRIEITQPAAGRSAGAAR